MHMPQERPVQKKIPPSSGILKPSAAEEGKGAGQVQQETVELLGENWTGSHGEVAREESNEEKARKEGILPWAQLVQVGGVDGEKKGYPARVKREGSLSPLLVLVQKGKL